jgi:hypothetical protein
MPPTFVGYIPIDSEWAEALVGFRLNIPNSWWLGFVDGGFNQGQIAAINFNALNAYYFEVSSTTSSERTMPCAMIPSSSTWTRGSRASRAFVYR